MITKQSGWKKPNYFLLEYNLSTNNLISWNDFNNNNRDDFDLVFHDLGNMIERQVSLPKVMECVKKEKGILLIDDIHKSVYKKNVISQLSAYKHIKFDLKPYTLDNFGRYCWLVTEINKK